MSRIALRAVALALVLFPSACQKPAAVEIGSPLESKMALAALPATIRCEDSRPLEIGNRDTGFATCANGLIHRPTALECPYVPRPLETLVEGVERKSGECTQDSDCQEKPNGSCDLTLPGGYPVCRYGCSTDADCASGELCECRAPAGRCVPARCKSDADCGGGTVCGRYWAKPGCFLSVGFACQTPNDQCAGDDVCRTERSNRSCTLDAAGRRICQPNTCIY